MTDPGDLYRRKGSVEVFNDYYPNGNLLNPWSNNIPKGKLLYDGRPILELSEYEVEQNYYWVMGDNRDDALDSRYWGYLPFSFIKYELILE